MTWWGGSGTGTPTSSNAAGGFTHTIYVRIEMGRSPPPPARAPKKYSHNAFDIMGIPRGSSLDLTRKRYRELAKVLHPDRGGDVGWMSVLNRAYDAIVKGAN